MISAVILAAGLSTRMGEPKQLLKFRGLSLIRRVANSVIAASIDEVIVVCGYAHEKVEAEVKDLPLTIIYNPEYEQGQGTSLAVGAKQVSKDSEALLVFLGDQPLISTETINRLIKKFGQSRCKALRPAYKGQPGHPVIFGPSLFEEIRSLQGDEGARVILDRYRNQMIEVPVELEEVVFDVDTAKEYEDLKAYY